MTKLFLVLIAFALTTQIGFANDAVINGKIGTYPVEMTVSKVDWESGEVEGRYRYANKTSYLTLNGQLYGSCIYLEEFYHEKKSGEFYLDVEEGALIGKWIANNKVMDVTLEWTTDLSNKLKYKRLEDFRKETNKNITGTYRNEVYFLNDMWLTEENPVMEIGYNGGAALIEEINADTIHFLVTAVCGPTYHLAYANGYAVKTKPNEYYCLYNANEGDSCEIFINMGSQSTFISAKSNNSFTCEFGMRAYLEHEFIKVDDNVDFESFEDY